MIEPQQVCAGCRCGTLDFQVVGIAHAKAASRPLVGDVRQRHRRGHFAAAPDQRAAALVRVGLAPVLLDGLQHARSEPQSVAHGQFTPLTNEPSGGSSQKRSERYFSPPSLKIITMTPSSIVLAIFRLAESAAPLEIPTSRPSSVARRRVRM